MKRASPVFLARRAYRQRRLRDGARLLPLAGGFFLLLPILWQPGETPTPDTAGDGIYLFVVWLVLIGIAAVLSLGLGTGEEAEAAIGLEEAAGPEPAGHGWPVSRIEGAAGPDGPAAAKPGHEGV